jgi:hypothetical protein
VTFPFSKFHENPPKVSVGVAKTKPFSKKMLSPGAVTPGKKLTVLPLQYALFHNVIFICTMFYQNPSKGLGEVVKTKYFFKEIA